MTMTEQWIVPVSQRVRTPFAHKKGGNVRPVELAIVHWTATPMSKAKHGDNPERIKRWLRGESGRESSTHLVITRAGEILQGAPLDWRTWHAGGSRTLDGRGDINQRSIGIDLELVGDLARGTNRWVDSYGGTYKGPEPHVSPQEPLARLEAWERRTTGQSRIEAWEPYRVAQLVSFFQVALVLSTRIPTLARPSAWLGHAEVRPTKLDPGPHFPWRTLALVLAREIEPGAIDDWHPAERRAAVDL